MTGYPRIISARIGETMHRTPKSLRGARTCSRSSITMPSLVGLGVHPPPGQPKTLSFLSVCLSATLLNVRVCAHDFAMKALEYRNDFDAVWYRKVCCCALVFNFLPRDAAMLARSWESVCLFVCLSVCLSHACFVTNPKNLWAIFLYHMKGQFF